MTGGFSCRSSSWELLQLRRRERGSSFEKRCCELQTSICLHLLLSACASLAPPGLLFSSSSPSLLLVHAEGLRWKCRQENPHAQKRSGQSNLFCILYAVFFFFFTSLSAAFLTPQWSYHSSSSSSSLWINKIVHQLSAAGEEQGWCHFHHLNTFIMKNFQEFSCY